MKRIHFNRLEDELAGAYTAIQCLFGVIIMAVCAAVLYRLGWMNWFFGAAFLVGSSALFITAVILVCRPEWKAPRDEADRLIAESRASRRL